MKLFPPEPEIDLYKEGFDEHDKLDRKKTGKRLSELVEKIKDPMIIALDGAWGSGKSHFLKCWVGAHQNENKGKATTIYFDAFAHDYLDDPLIALTGVLSDRFKEIGIGEKTWEMAKQAASKLWRPALRTAVAVGTAGIVSKADDMVDAGAESIGKELTTEEFWEKEDSKRVAVKEFKDALEKMTVPKEGDGDAVKIVIVVDELDRCRPDYALAMLEVMKHFFAVPNVHFVLGVNLQELENSVRARYGNGIDAAKYLQKFYHIRFPITNKLDGINKSGNAHQYYEKICNDMDISNEQYRVPIDDFVKALNISNSISLRDVERIITKQAITPACSYSRQYHTFALVALLIVISVIRPDWISKIIDRTLSESDLDTIFSFPETEFSRQNIKEMGLLMKELLLSEFTDEEWQKLNMPNGRKTLDQRQTDMRKYVSYHLDSVAITRLEK